MKDVSFDSDLALHEQVVVLLMVVVTFAARTVDEDAKMSKMLVRISQASCMEYTSNPGSRSFMKESNFARNSYGVTARLLVGRQIITSFRAFRIGIVPAILWSMCSHISGKGYIACRRALA